MNSLRILGILIDCNVNNIDSLQYTLTKFGNVIRTRIGLNDVNEPYSGRRSIIILELFGDMLEMGILDPTKVTRTALQNAASVAGLMITT